MENICDKFKQACLKGKDTENILDAGAGIKNVWVDCRTIVQVFTQGTECRVWVVGYDEGGSCTYARRIEWFSEEEQYDLLRRFKDVVGFDEPKDDEFDKLEGELVDFCLKNGLVHERSRGWREIDFVMEYHDEAIDTATLENPTCICTERHIVIWLPKVGDNPTYEERRFYDLIRDRLTCIGTPNYIIGAKEGVVKAVMYCVWG